MRETNVLGRELANDASANARAEESAPAWCPTLGVAQTNVQLYNQLWHAGTPTSDVVRVQSGYDFALVLFVRSYRASGKSTLAHHLGVASLLVGQRAPIDVVLAGLLHAAYPLGDFGDGRSGVTSRRRSEVRAVVGEVPERIIDAFARLRWNRHEIGDIASSLATADELHRQVVLVRLANEIENYLDLNMAYCGQYEFRRRFAAERQTTLVAMARALDAPVLASALEQVFAEFARCDVPSELRRPTRLGIDIRPRSMRRRLRPSLRLAWGRLRARFGARAHVGAED